MGEPDGPRTVGGIGDVALRHFRDLRGFEHYKGYYSKREEAQSIFEREMVKKSSGFAAYIDVSCFFCMYRSLVVWNRRLFVFPFPLLLS